MPSLALTPSELRRRYRAVRAVTESLCAPLLTEDYQTQSRLEASPPKWHIAHVTWFFETFLLRTHLPGHELRFAGFDVLFNSYYESIGQFHPRDQRGLLARPSVEEVYRYRRAIDAGMEALFDRLDREPDTTIEGFIELGLHHEQQHQELLCMDIKAHFAANPLRPVYRADLPRHTVEATVPMRWVEQGEGLHEIGHAPGSGFAFDNESPRHRVWLDGYQLADRLVTNGEYLAFIEAGGYSQARWWLSDGWAHIRRHGWQHPLYWVRDGEGGWLEMTLGGWRKLDVHAPVCHVSYYEAEAFARWAGARLPTEAEIEVVQARQPLRGNFFDQGFLQPMPAGPDGQWWGDLWTWTGSAYLPYPGFRPLEGSAGEYNGKFMCNQMVLRGGCCATSIDHMRASYRNFFCPPDRWAYTGIRLARTP
ncbi:ergothioneine biosynthesis protein EgtB [Sphaerotilus sp.]|uniref:ergothioneine biosynthesis protein EgtB n=1 Tax=Sphaerotilus sp. TaxID=2093942 RepID=UPI002ACD3372|nr:ergothioneine biosynthesis protein EgtB [Sphaerotilus sp.]MDZ7858673.1 ergothioneine biosynthesis protein EgtB [Sphaerotilus sp.]